MGQVVCQVAGGAKCKKCIGIEKAEVPADFARVSCIDFHVTRCKNDSFIESGIRISEMDEVVRQILQRIRDY